MDYVADRLGGTKLTAIDPTERAKALEPEDTLDQAFGRGVQQVLYSAFLNDMNLTDITEVWRRGSVIGSWLLDPNADALLRDPQLEAFGGRVSASG